MHCILITNNWTKHQRLHPVVYTEQEAIDWIKSRSVFYKWNNKLEIFKLIK